MIVSWAMPAAFERLKYAAYLKIHFLDHALIGLLRSAIEIKQMLAERRRFDSASSPGASHGQCGALKCRLIRNGRPDFAYPLMTSTARPPSISVR